MWSSGLSRFPFFHSPFLFLSFLLLLLAWLHHDRWFTWTASEHETVWNVYPLIRPIGYADRDFVARNVKRALNIHSDKKHNGCLLLSSLLRSCTECEECEDLTRVTLISCRYIQWWDRSLSRTRLSNSRRYVEPLSPSAFIPRFIGTHEKSLTSLRCLRKISLQKERTKSYRISSRMFKYFDFLYLISGYALIGILSRFPATAPKKFLNDRIVDYVHQILRESLPIIPIHIDPAWSV